MATGYASCLTNISRCIQPRQSGRWLAQYFTAGSKVALLQLQQLRILLLQRAYFSKGFGFRLCLFVTMSHLQLGLLQQKWLCSRVVAYRLQPATMVQTPHALLESVSAHVEKQQQSKANVEKWQRMLTWAEAAAIASAHQVRETHQAAKELQLRETTGHPHNPPSILTTFAEAA